MPILLLVTFVTIRLLSLTTYQQPFLNGILAALLIGGFACICIKNPKYGWFILLGELLLDGAGHFFELRSLLLRTWFLGIFGLMWLIKKIRNPNFKLPDRPIFRPMIALGLVILGATINGYFSHHSTTIIVQDALLFAFLGLVFPAIEWKEDLAKPLTTITKVWILGSTLFSITTFAWYASGFGILRDTYYHWFRNIAAGKITDLGQNFFRVVLPEHELIIPVILGLAAFLIWREQTNTKRQYLWGLMLLSLSILTLNFSRIYFVALALGFLLLFSKKLFKEWFAISAICVTSLIIVFFGFHLVASRGQSIGLELLGLRAAGTNLHADTSGAIRLAILPDALRQIQAKPWFGSGLGAVVTYPDPTTHELVTRSQFDWGYLEMLAELGIIGTLIFLFFYSTVLYQLTKIKTPLGRGLLAGGISLLVVNITMPVLFHGFGVLYIVLLMTVANDVSVQSRPEPAHTA